MTVTLSAETQPEVLPYRTFDTEVVALRRLSPSFLRVTVTGDELRDFADNGLDQRIKVILPLAGAGHGGFEHFPRETDWFLPWRALPDERRNPVRTYTVRSARPALREVDIDLVLHGDAGPASRWANRAVIGDRILLVGPDGRFDGPHGGLVWNPPAGAEVLLVGDETAVPAIAAILERLAPGTTGRALMEVPAARDALDDVSAPPGVELLWFFRGFGRTVGDLLVPALRELFPAAGRAADVADLPEGEVLWDVEELTGPSTGYAWLAGEAGMVVALRRHLLRDAGWPKGSVVSMGYWKYGVAGA
ncbi:siderophore-interacting protein [Spongisporangium articulatum]|uniref:Siderophore-interacting protein n=1 Tax=Spongisporangium articulatum TaxID=3362603 RepID=A0ABW8APR9_9ACTN